MKPKHTFYHNHKHINFTYTYNNKILKTFQLLSHTKKIIPTLKNTHTIIKNIKQTKTLKKKKIIIINLSNHKNKNIQQITKILKKHI